MPDAIVQIENIFAATGQERFDDNIVTRVAVERFLEIICEASRHVPPAMKSRSTDIDWAQMVDLGNILRHAYHRIDTDTLEKIVRTDLPPLKSFVERILAEERPS